MNRIAFRFQHLLDWIAFFSGVYTAWSAPTEIFEEFNDSLWKRNFQTKIYFSYSTDKNYLELRLIDLYKDLFGSERKATKELKKTDDQI